MKKIPRFSIALKAITPNTEYTRVFMDKTAKIHKEFIRCAIDSTDGNITCAMRSIEKDKLDIPSAIKYFEDAIKTANLLCEDSESLKMLDKKDKKILSRAYAEYAEFLRWSETSDKYDLVKKYVTSALLLDPNNTRALEIGGDLDYSYGKHI